jgi:hypothetical protein
MKIQGVPGKCSILVHEPSHAALMWAIYGTPITSKQSNRKSPVYIPWLPLRPVLDSTGRFDRPFDFASGIDQKSIVLYLHLKGI